MKFAVLLMCLVALTLESYSGLSSASVLRGEPVASLVNGNEPSAESDDEGREVVNGEQRPIGCRGEGGSTSGERDSFFPTWSRTWTNRNGDRTSLGTYGRDDDSLAGFRGSHSWNNDRSFLGGFFERDQRNNGTSAGFRLSHRWKRAAREQGLNDEEEEDRVRRSPQGRFDWNATLDNDRYGTRGTLSGLLSTPTWNARGRYSYGTDGHTVGGEIGRTWRHDNGASTTFGGFGHYNSERGGSIGIGLSHRWRRSLREAQSQGNGHVLRTRRSPDPQGRFDWNATLDNDRYGTRGTLSGLLSTPTWNGLGRYSYGTDGHTLEGEIGRTWRHDNGASTTFGGFGHYNSHRGGSIGIGLSHRWRRSLREKARAGIMPELEPTHLRRISAEGSNGYPMPNDYQDVRIQGTPIYRFPVEYYYGQDQLME